MKFENEFGGQAWNVGIFKKKFQHSKPDPQTRRRIKIALSLLDLTRCFADVEGTSLFFSGGDLDSAKKSVLALFPYDKFSLKPPYTQNPWDLTKDAQETPWVGFFGYEMGVFADTATKAPYYQAETPDALFYKPTLMIIVDHTNDTTDIHLDEQGITLIPEQQRIWCQQIIEGQTPNRQPKQSPSTPIKVIKNGTPYNDYINLIERTKEYIHQGDIYQANISQEFIFEGQTSPFNLFHHLCTINPAPFMAFMQCGDFEIISSSPERFIQKKGNDLETRPIKGTAPRHKNPEIDLINKKQLLDSPKERAELLMITDLMRNDLGRVSIAGSVDTKKIWHCEAYSNVYHLLSIIHSQALPNLHPVDIIRRIFPGGSITGCPKLRALEIIAEMEQRPRGIYTGSIGYFDHNGDFDFNIAIRTITIKENTINIQLGGGIVYDSDPESEYKETLYKGKSIFNVIKLLNKKTN